MKNKALKSVDFWGRKSGSPDQVKNDSQNPTLVPSDEKENIVFKISDKILEFNKKGNITNLLRETAKSNIYKTQKDFYEFPKNLRMFSKQKFERLKQASIKK